MTLTQMPLDRLSLKGCSVEVVQLNVQSPIGASHQYQRTLPAFDHVIVIRRRSESGRDVFLSLETESQKVQLIGCKAKQLRRTFVSDCHGRKYNYSFKMFCTQFLLQTL